MEWSFYLYFLLSFHLFISFSAEKWEAYWRSSKGSENLVCRHQASIQVRVGARVVWVASVRVTARTPVGISTGIMKVGNKIEVKVRNSIGIELRVRICIGVKIQSNIKLTSGLGLCSQLTLGLGLLRSGLELLLPKTKLESYLNYYDFLKTL